MGMREKLNEKPALVGGIAAVLVLGAVLLVYMQLSGSGIPRTPLPTRAFYTDDNGQTYFEDDINKALPFDHNGKQAYRAYVYQCGSDKPFVAVIGRHTAQGRELMEENMALPPDQQNPTLHAEIQSRTMQIKKIEDDDKKWIANDAAAGLKLLDSITCPSGEPAKKVLP